jgi:hypothetical protein
MSVGIKVLIVGTVLFLMCVPPLLYFKFGLFKKCFHDVLRWHIPKGIEFYDGSSFHSYCKYCDEEIMQDSQGNWF